MILFRGGLVAVPRAENKGVRKTRMDMAFSRLRVELQAEGKVSGNGGKFC